MIALLDRPDRPGLLANVSAAITVVLIVNGVIFGFGWQGASGRAPAFLPPPIVIGLVWIGLFACMALSRWELNRRASRRSDKAGLIVLFVLCATYPFYTAGLKNDLIGEGANLALLLLAAQLAIGYARRGVSRAAAWIVPVFLWLSFASVAGAFSLAHAG